MRNNSRIDKKVFIRNQEIEDELGIKDLKLYAFVHNNTLRVTGEVFGTRLKDRITFLCTVYDEDNDVIAGGENRTYGEVGWLTNEISPKCFYNGFPFGFEFDVPKNAKIAAIRVEAKKEY